MAEANGTQLLNRPTSEIGFASFFGIEVAEQVLLDEAATPFQDGGLLYLKSDRGPEAYEIRNDGRTIAVSRADRADFGCNIFGENTPYYGVGNNKLVSIMAQILEKYPFTNDLHAIIANDDRIVTEVRLATLAALHADQRYRLQGLGTAGIRFVQSGAAGNADALPFVSKLAHDKRFLVSQDVRGYLHDISAHWMGSIALQADNFDIACQLFFDRGEITGEESDQEQAFIDSLSAGYDFSTGFLLQRPLRKNKVSWSSADYLLHTIASETRKRCSQGVFARCIQKIGELTDMEPVVRERLYDTEITIPWELKYLPDHYLRVFERLQAVD